MAVRWLMRVPTWVWVFIAATQILTIVDRAIELPRLDAAIQEFGPEPAYQDVKSGFERIRSREHSDLVIALIVAPLSIALAFWSWSRQRRIPSQNGGPAAPPETPVGPGAGGDSSPPAP